MTGPRRLTDAQLQHVTQARTLAASAAEEIAGLGDASAGNEAAVYAIAYGRTQAAVTALLSIIDELTGGDMAPDDRLARIAAVLAEHDWEHDSPRYALEGIALIISHPGGAS